MTASGPRRYEPLVAAAVIMLVFGGAWFVMPRIMLLVSGGGPLAGVLVAVAFMLAFFGVLWLRARHQRRIERE